LDAAAYAAADDDGEEVAEGNGRAPAAAAVGVIGGKIMDEPEEDVGRDEDEDDPSDVTLERKRDDEDSEGDAL
jgi:hypothetical protein